MNCVCGHNTYQHAAGGKHCRMKTCGCVRYREGQSGYRSRTDCWRRATNSGLCNEHYLREWWRTICQRSTA